MNDVISDVESFLPGITLPGIRFVGITLPGITLPGIRLLEEERVIRQTETVPTQAAH